MGTSLFNTTPAATYPALIKVGDNTSIDGTLKTLSDGAGNDLPIQVSSTVTNFTGNVGLGAVSPIAKLQVNGTQVITNADITGYNLYSSFNLVRNGATSIALDRFTGAPHFNFRAAGGTIASPSTQVGELGNIGWWSYSGTAFNRNVLLLAEASNFVGGLAQTQRLSIGMGESGPSSNYYFSMVNGNTFFGSGASSVTPTARLQVRGSGSTSATTSLLVQNSIADTSLEVKDDGQLRIPVKTGQSINNLLIDANTSGSTATPKIALIASGFNAQFYIAACGPASTGAPSAIVSKGLLQCPSGIAFTTNNAGAINNTDISLLLYQSKSVHINGFTEVASAVLNVESTTKGFLMPRMTTVQRDAIASPATGLQVFNTTLGTVDTYDGTGWDRFGSQTLIRGAGSTSATTSLLVQNSLGTTLLQTLDDATTTLAGKTFTGTGTILVPSQAHSASDIVMKGDSALISANGNANQWGKIILCDVGAGTTYQNYSVGHFFKIGTTSPITYLSIVANLVLTGSSTRLQMGAQDASDIYQGTSANVYGSFLPFGSTGNTVFKNSYTQGSYRFFTAPAVDGTLVEALRITNTGILSIGTTTPNASAKVDISSTTQGFLPPRMTTAQRLAIASPPNGLIVFDTDVQNLCYRRDSTWVQVSFTAV
jgi:hypothetical protein